MVFDGAFLGFAGEPGVDDGAGDGFAGGEVFDVFPADGMFLIRFTRKTDAGESLTAGEDDAAVLVVPGVVFILAQNGELDAVDRAEFVNRQAECTGNQHINFNQRLTTGIVRPQRCFPVPILGKRRERT